MAGYSTAMRPECHRYLSVRVANDVRWDTSRLWLCGAHDADTRVLKRGDTAFSRCRQSLGFDYFSFAPELLNVTRREGRFRKQV